MSVILDSTSVVCATVVDGAGQPPQQDYSQLIGIIVVMAMMGMMVTVMGGNNEV